MTSPALTRTRAPDILRAILPAQQLLQLGDVAPPRLIARTPRLRRMYQRRGSKQASKLGQLKTLALIFLSSLFPLPIAARPKPHSPFSNRAGPSHSTGAGVSALRE